MSKRVLLVLPDDIYDSVEEMRGALIKRNTYLVHLIRRGIEAEERDKKRKG